MRRFSLGCAVIGWLVDKVAGPIMAKLLIGVSAALVLSIGANVLQLFYSGFAAGESSAQGDAAKKVEAATGELSKAIGELEAVRESTARSAEIARSAAEDQMTVAADFALIAEAARETKIVYKTRVEQLPAAGCPPGKERQDAFNEAMRR